MTTLEELPDNVIIRQGAMVFPAYVPVYLPDRTLAGKAAIYQDEKGVFAQVELTDPSLGGLIKEELIGLSIMYLEGAPEEASVVAPNEDEEKN